MMRYKWVRKQEFDVLVKENEIFKAGIKRVRQELFNDQSDYGIPENGEALIDNLIKAISELKNQQQESLAEEEKRRWINEGITQIAAIQVRGNHNIEHFYITLLTRLVQYMGANQGGLFVVSENDAAQSISLELVSSYAYQRRRYMEKSIKPGEGLVGQCYLEKEYILLTEIPDGYTTITSGLGEATPGYLLIYPLITDEKVVGIIEIASFKQFEQCHLDFCQKVSEGIASAIHNFMISERTHKLLDLSKKQTEELRTQEEELRQNMEEMIAMREQIQEQLNRARELKTELEIREKVFGYTTILSESDRHGTITYANNKLCEISQYTREELIGKPHNIFRHPDMPAELFRSMWTCIKQGKIFRGVIKNKAKDGSHYWVDAVIVPISDETGTIIKYVGARYHIQDDLLAETLYHRNSVKRFWYKENNSILKFESCHSEGK